MSSEKLSILLAECGYQDLEELKEQTGGSSPCPGICRNEYCDNIADVDIHCTKGHCDVCGKYTVVSAYMLK
jgi:hypothetical protein